MMIPKIHLNLKSHTLIPGLASAPLGIMAPSLFLRSLALEVLLPLQPRLVGGCKILHQLAVSFTHANTIEYGVNTGLNMWMNIIHTCNTHTNDELTYNHVCVRACICVWHTCTHMENYNFIVGTQHFHLTASSDVQSRKTKWLPKSISPDVVW